MPLKHPESMDEVIYFTKRAIDVTGHAKAWVYKQKCPKCGKALMGKPIDEKTGKPKIRAKEYKCPECGYTVEKQEYEETLTCEIAYTCPHCSHKGEAAAPFKRKKVQRLDESTGKKQAVEVIRFQCEKCGKDIDITKKMK